MTQTTTAYDAGEPPFDPDYDTHTNGTAAGVEARPPATPLDAAQENERAFLGALLTFPEQAAKHLPLVRPEDLYQPRHATILNTIQDLVDKGLIPDHPTVLGRLHENKAPDLQGLSAYLLELRAAAPFTPQVEHYADIIRDAAGLRRLDTEIVRMRQRITTARADDIKSALADLSDLADQVATNFGPNLHDPHGRLVVGDTFILDRPTHIPAAWGQDTDILWAQGEALIIAGPAGVGKTTIAQQVMLAGIGLRPAVLGHPVRPFTRVLYIAADRPPQAARSLERMVTKDDRDTLHDHLVFWKGPPDRDFAKHPDELTRMCQQAQADAVIIDSLKDVALGLSDDEVGAGLNSAIQRALVAGVEVLALHHNRKRSQDHAKTKPKSLDEIYGSTWITAGAGSVLSLWGQAGDPVVHLDHLKQPADEFGPAEITHDHDTGTSRIDRGVDLLEQLRQRGRNGLTPTAAACLISKKDKPNRNDIEKARRQLERLRTSGLAVKDPMLTVGRGTEAVYLPAARKDQTP